MNDLLKREPGEIYIDNKELKKPCLAKSQKNCKYKGANRKILLTPAILDKRPCISGI
jgi:hypothetical protein